MKRISKHKDWTGVLQERLRDAALPLETDSAPLSADFGRRRSFPDGAAEGPSRRVGWWPWALAGAAAAALAAVLLLRPVPPSVNPAPSTPLVSSDLSLPYTTTPHPGPDPESLLAQNAGPDLPSADPSSQSFAGPDTPSFAGSDRRIPDEAPLSAAGQEERNPSSDLALNEDGGRPDTALSSNMARNEDGEGNNDVPSSNPVAGEDRRIPGQARDEGKVVREEGMVWKETLFREEKGARRARLALHVQASAAGSSFAGGRATSPLVLSWTENRTVVKTFADYGASSIALSYSDGTVDVSPGVAIPQGSVVLMNETNTVSRPVSRAPALPVSFGVSAELGLGRRWSLLSGLEYTQRAGYRMSGNLPQALTLHYLGVPLEARFHFLPENRFRLYLGAGLKAEKCIAATGGTPLQDPFLYSGSIQAGADFRLAPGVRIYLAPVVSQYFNRSAYSNDWDGRPQFSLRAGLSFDL